MSIDPTSRITNQVNPTHQMNNNGGGLGGGNASSYKNDQNEQSLINEKPHIDEFTPSEPLQKETNDDISDKSILVLFIEFMGSFFSSIIGIFGFGKQSDDGSDAKENNLP